MTEKDKMELLKEAKQDAIDIMEALCDAPNQQPQPQKEKWPILANGEE